MNRSKRASLRELRLALNERLSRDGFTKQAGLVYFLPLSEGVYGWLGLNRAVRDPHRLASLNPVIGVRRDDVMSLRSELSGQDIHPATATFARPLGYVMPDQTYREWPIESHEGIARVVDDVTTNIRRFGVPQMTRWADLSSLLEAIEQHGQILEYQAEDVPIILALLGRRAEAAGSVSGYLERMAGRLSYPKYRKFAVAFDKYLARDHKPKTRMA